MGKASRLDQDRALEKMSISTLLLISTLQATAALVVSPSASVQQRSSAASGQFSQAVSGRRDFAQKASVFAGLLVAGVPLGAFAAKEVAPPLGIFEPKGQKVKVDPVLAAAKAKRMEAFKKQQLALKNVKPKVKDDSPKPLITKL